MTFIKKKFKYVWMKLIQVLCEKCPNTEVFLVCIFRIWTEYVEIICISPYSARMQENTDQKSLRILTPFTQWDIHYCWSRDVAILFCLVMTLVLISFCFFSSLSIWFLVFHLEYCCIVCFIRLMNCFKMGWILSPETPCNESNIMGKWKN